MARPLLNSSHQTNMPQFVHKDWLNPFPHHHHPSAHVNPHQFAENQPLYFSNEHPQNLQEPYPSQTCLNHYSQPEPKQCQLACSQ
ncbi:hypothetical protein L1987_22914 [Smallanthus sonchifolius]|uniref:Uncharacterized protein n=1 Tax=Smallanthus sonchifolius TaxID=185202 RepID=A0ACB9IFG4_9ASTR|nr:hypothetical protein L1987_22914 [Smallanthus sonchifolius]